MKIKQCRKVDGNIFPTSFIKHFMLVIFLSITMISKADVVYPIDLFAAMLPPYTNCIGDYFEGGRNRMKLTAVVRDLTKQGRNLSISVSVKVKSGNTIYLESRTPIQQIVNVRGMMSEINTHKLFTDVDLNVKGKLKENGYCLPEGAYEFVYQVFDGYDKTLPLSLPVSVFCFLSQAEPPIGVFPPNGDCIQELPSIPFQWVDAVACSKPHKSYRFEIHENMVDATYDNGMFGTLSQDNNFLVLSDNVYNSNTYILQNSAGKLKKNKKYFWRVKVLPDQSNDLNDGDFAYKNVGYSAWSMFTYGCDPIVIPERKSEYKKELNVEATNDMDSTAVEEECDTNISQVECDSLRNMLNPGDSFIANDENTVVTVTDAVKNGDGSFSGKGAVSCTLLKKELGLNVTFDHVFINQEDELCRGVVRVVTSEKDRFLLNLNKIAQKDYAPGKATGQEIVCTSEVNDIETIRENPENYHGQIVLVGGKDIVAVDGKGEIVKVATVAENACPPARQSFDNEYGTIHFDVANFNTPKFEPYIDKFAGDFNKCPEVSQGYEHFYSYTVPWLAMLEGEARWIKATVDANSKSQYSLRNMADRVKFYCVSQRETVELLSSYDASDGTYKVMVFGGLAGQRLEIYAMVDGDGFDIDCDKTSRTVGKINIYTMKRKEKRVAVVPVMCDAKLNENIENKISELFAPLGRTFNFVEKERFDGNDTLRQLLVQGLNTREGGNVFTNETVEMKYLRKLYKKSVEIDSDADAYLFLLPANKVDGISGYMPRTSSVGYIFVGKDSTSGRPYSDHNTVAHELCHGLFGLQHTFDYGVEKKRPVDNIMSYSTQSDRYPTKYFQWNQIQNPAWYKMPFVDDEEDGEYFLNFDFTWIGDWKGGILNFDSQEKAIIDLSVLEIVYKNYNSFFSKSKKQNFEIEGSGGWNGRKKGKSNICKSICDKLVNITKKNDPQKKTSFDLYDRGVYFDPCSLDLDGTKKEFNVAIYSFKEKFNIDSAKTRQPNYSALANCKYVKAGYTDRYAFVVFYNDDLSPKMLVQIWNGESTEKLAYNWVNYLGIVVGSDAQKKTDIENIKKQDNSEEKKDDGSHWYDAIVEYFIGAKNAVDIGKVWGEGYSVEDYVKATQDAVAFANKHYPNIASCNVCVRTALLYLTGDSILFPDKTFVEIEENGKFHKYKGSITDPGRAYHMYNDLKRLIDNPRTAKDELLKHFLPIEKPQESFDKNNSLVWNDFLRKIQTMADNGTAVIGIYSKTIEKSHIIMIVPGGLMPIDNSVQLYGNSFTIRGVSSVPRILECGYDVSKKKEKGNNHPICRAMSANEIVISNFYKYVP